MATREWRYKVLEGNSSQPNWTLSSLGSTNLLTLCSMAVGETILRTRVQGQIMYEVRDTTPATTQMGTFNAGSQYWGFGVWMSKTGTSVPAQTPPILGSLRDEFVFWNQMTLINLDTFHSQDNIDRWNATYGFVNNDNDSTSSRGPCTATSVVQLTWGHANAGFEPMLNTTAGISAFFAYYMQWGVLIETP